jgi:TatD DNase family protein
MESKAMQWVDTHVHINFDRFQADLDDVAARWRAAGLVRLVHSCVEPSEFAQIQALADRFPELRFAVGLHPLDVDQWTPELGETIAQLAASDSRVVAIGETGLDLFKSDRLELQKEAFWAQLRIARQLGRPVIVHCRDAADEAWRLLVRFQSEEGPVSGVMHCWGGTPEEAARFVELGFYISFSGTVTFKKAEQIQASARAVPLDRLLVETDCPFLAPMPHRGQRNEPAFVYHVAQQVALLRDLSLEQLASQTTANADRLFNLSL